MIGICRPSARVALDRMAADDWKQAAFAHGPQCLSIHDFSHMPDYDENQILLWREAR